MMTSEKKLNPGLYLVATPIGNLGDMTARAVEVLKGVDVILCEDTRVTRKLLTHYDIHTPVRVYNAQSDAARDPEALNLLRQGGRVALVSDAGTPLISDPGYPLVAACYESGVAVTAVPGANAVLTALQLSGLPSDAFVFIGFLPVKSAERRRKLAEWAGVPATLITYERAERVEAVLTDMIETFGDRPAAIVREMTKMFEESRRGTLANLKESIGSNPLKGEVVVVVARAPEGQEIVDDATILRHLKMATHEGLSSRDAAAQVAKQLGIPKKRVYTLSIQ